MATFIGTVDEFHKYIGPRIRNRINTYPDVKAARLARNGICEHCGKKEELQSAHVHGHGRRDIIETVLAGYQHSQSLQVDIGIVEDEILQAHHPISESFLFLCGPCHRKYDAIPENSSKQKQTTESTAKVKSTPSEVSAEIVALEIAKVKRRVPRWFRNPTQFNAQILTTYLKLASRTSTVELDNLAESCSHIPTFDNNYNQMKLFGVKNHAKVFEEVEGLVYLWPPVKEFVQQTYRTISQLR